MPLLRTLLALCTLAFSISIGACSCGTPQADGDEGEGEGTSGGIDRDASAVTVTPSGGVPADGLTAYRIVVQVIGTDGAPLSGIQLALEGPAAGLSFSQPLATDTDGRSSGTVASTSEGDHAIDVVARTSDGDVVLDTVTLDFLEACEDIEQLFERAAWGPVFSRCAGCHNELGLARAYGLELQFKFPGEPDWATHNVSVIASLAAQQTNGPDGTPLSRLIAKPTGRAADEGHEGGTVIDPASEEARVLEAFAAAALDPPAGCGGAVDDVQLALGALVLASPRETFVRAKLALTGAPATLAEAEAVEDSEAGLSAAIDGLLASEAFYDRLGEWYGDWTLTDGFLFFDPVPLGPFDRRYAYFDAVCAQPGQNNCCDPQFGGCCQDTQTPQECQALERSALDALAREPLELIQHLARNDLPMDGLVTASTGMMTPLSAILRGATDAQIAAAFDADPSNDATEFKPLRLLDTDFNQIGMGPSGEAAWPHAGMLNAPVVLARWPSSTSNKQRGRAFQVIDRMLAMPLMDFSEFNTATIPTTADLQQATQQYQACMVCHTAMDPIAATFSMYGQGPSWDPNRTLAAFMPPPAFFITLMPTPAVQDGAEWLGAQLAAHPRFSYAITRPVFTGLTGAEPLKAPKDLAHPNYAADLLAFRIQNAALTDLGARLRSEMGMQLKPLAKAIVMGPFFRAASTAAPVDATRAAALAKAGVGRGALITPEQIARRITATTGVVYDNGVAFGFDDLFTSLADYRLLWGGLDYRDVTTRFRSTSPLHGAIAARMGNEVACEAVPIDLERVDADRLLLPGVTVQTMPIDAGGNPDAAGAQAIRDAIRHLHAWLLGELLTDDDPELEASMALWREAFDLGRAGMLDGSVPPQLRACRTPTLTTDPDYTVRAWVTVVSYLLSDSRFLFD